MLTLPGKQVRNFDTAPVKLGFSSIFWNTAWTGRQAPTTLGILCDPEASRAGASFPPSSTATGNGGISSTAPARCGSISCRSGTEPIVRVIDDWVTARPLGLVVEGKVGAGKIDHLRFRSHARRRRSGLAPDAREPV